MDPQVGKQDGASERGETKEQRQPSHTVLLSEAFSCPRNRFAMEVLLFSHTGLPRNTSDLLKVGQ